MSNSSKSNPRREINLVWPMILIGIGLIFLLTNLGIVSGSVWEWVGTLWPVFLILIGLESILNRRGLVGATVMICLGAIFLMANFGLLAMDIWSLVLQFWPILLIAIGFDIIFGRRSLILSLFGVLLVVAILIGAVWYSSFPVRSTQITATTINQTLEGATQADVQIDTGVGEVNIGSLDEGDALVAGSVPQGAGLDVRQEFSVDGEVANYRLWQTGSSAWVFPAPRNGFRWDLQLNPEAIRNLELNLGVGQAELELQDIELENLQIQTAVGNTVLTLPAQGNCQVQVEGAIGKLTVLVPAGVGLQIQASSGIGTTNVPEDYIRNGSNYRSPDFEQAKNHVNLNVSNAIGLIEIKPLP
ncbi:MAG TPA: DUF5668 domain-containing protein [Anaerolineales bacterium]|nr:DUF5668 domain-containing protein [Anaerolineales bacterium]